MASHTRKTKIRRKLRKKKMGKRRKKILKNKGTTPKFPIHLEEENQSVNTESGATVN